MDSFNLLHTPCYYPIAHGMKLRFAPKFTRVMGKEHTPCFCSWH